MPNSSRLSLGMIGLPLVSSAKVKRRMKSSSVKCLEHRDEFRVGSHLARFCFTKLTISFYVFQLQADRRNRKVQHAELNPSPHLGRQNIPQLHIYPAYFEFGTAKQLRNDQALVRCETKLTSHASQYPVSQLLLFEFKMAENGLFSGISSAD